VLGTFNVLEAARALFPDALIAHISTNNVYGVLEWLRYKETTTRYFCPNHPVGGSMIRWGLISPPLRLLQERRRPVRVRLGTRIRPQAGRVSPFLDLRRPPVRLL
jgi:hypothetical protein